MKLVTGTKWYPFVSKLCGKGAVASKIDFVITGTGTLSVCVKQQYKAQPTQKGYHFVAVLLNALCTDTSFNKIGVCYQGLSSFELNFQYRYSRQRNSASFYTIKDFAYNYFSPQIQFSGNQCAGWGSL